MRKLLTLAMIATALVIIAPTTPDVSAQPQTDTVPYWLEPAPVCGSDLHIVEGGACLATDLAPITIGARVCPALSAGRFAGGSYDYVADPLALITYASASSTPIRDAEDKARTWDRYCAIPIPTNGGGASPTPAPTSEPTPAPTTTPAPIVVVCPTGTILDGVEATSGRPRCAVITATPTTNSLVPVFTG